MRRVEATLIDSITLEMVTGKRGKKMACQGSGKKTQAVRRK
jgi:hypothetical protein